MQHVFKLQYRDKNNKLRLRTISSYRVKPEVLEQTFFSDIIKRIEPQLKNAAHLESSGFMTLQVFLKNNYRQIHKFKFTVNKHMQYIP